MNVASLENCKELFELSEWDDSSAYWTKDTYPATKFEPFVSDLHEGTNFKHIAPAYDLGFLLRKLPPYLGTEDDDWLLRLMPSYLGETWSIGYAGLKDLRFLHAQQGDIPENALCKLAIQLFKQGLLTKPTTPTDGSGS